MKFPTKAQVKQLQTMLTAKANHDTIEFLSNQVLNGITTGLVSRLPNGFDRDSLVEYFDKNTEWRLTFSKQMGGEEPDDVLFETWKLT